MGGLRAAEGVRKAGYTGDVVVVGDETRMPYNRPPLSKDALAGTTDVDTLTFRVPRGGRGRPVAPRRVRHLRRPDRPHGHARRRVGARRGTGWSSPPACARAACRSRARPQGRHVIRTLEDALRPAGVASPAGPASSSSAPDSSAARWRPPGASSGPRSTCVAPEAVPMERPSAADGRRRAAAAGTRRTASSSTSARCRRSSSATTSVTGVRLADGTELAADVVVEAVGCAPNVEWLDGNGLDLRDGVVCDNHLRVEGRPDVVACGDIAKFPNLLFDDVPRRVEHWTMVTDTAKKAGHSLGTLSRERGHRPRALRADPVVLERPVRPPHPVLRLHRPGRRRHPGPGGRPRRRRRRRLPPRRRAGRGRAGRPGRALHGLPHADRRAARRRAERGLTGWPRVRSSPSSSARTGR